MLRRTLLLFAAMALLAPPPAMAADDDPVAVVRELYRVHGESEKTKASVFKPPHRDRFFARALVRLLAEEDKRREPRMQYDPIYDAQDYKIADLQIAQKSRQGEKAVVEARFKNFDKPTRVEYDLVRERGAWRIADIRNKGMQPDGMLTRILRQR
jgi:hypothetical protein